MGWEIAEWESSILRFRYHSKTCRTCEKNSRLYHALSLWLGQACPWQHKTHLVGCLWMVVALIHSGEVNVPHWLVYLPCRGQYAQSKQRRVSRWLHNQRIQVHTLYQPLIRAALSHWQQRCLYLSLDTSLFWDEYCLVRVAVVYRGRALPVAWRVLHHPSASVAFEAYCEMLHQAAACMPAGVKVVLLADRGFVHGELMRACVRRWHWHYRIRLKKDTWLWRAGQGWCQLKNLHFARGEALCFHHVRLHKQQRYGPVHVACGRNSVNGEYWAVVSDEPTTLQTFREYGLRFDIEESFLDDQSNGWNVQTSQIRSADALSRLWFILALATLYVTAQGCYVVSTGQRRWVDPHWFRGNSYFRIGWQWVKAALEHGWRLLRSVRFTSSHDPDPVMPSRMLHHNRAYRLEFKVQTFTYAPD